MCHHTDALRKLCEDTQSVGSVFHYYLICQIFIYLFIVLCRIGYEAPPGTDLSPFTEFIASLCMRLVVSHSSVVFLLA